MVSGVAVPRFQVAIKIKIPKSKAAQKAGKWGMPRDPIVKAALIVFVVLAATLGGTFTYFYVKYDRIIEKKCFCMRRFKTAQRAVSAVSTRPPRRNAEAMSSAARSAVFMPIMIPDEKIGSRNPAASPTRAKPSPCVRETLNEKF